MKVVCLATLIALVLSACGDDSTEASEETFDGSTSADGTETDGTDAVSDPEPGETGDATADAGVDAADLTDANDVTTDTSPDDLSDSQIFDADQLDADQTDSDQLDADQTDSDQLDADQTDTALADAAGDLDAGFDGDTLSNDIFTDPPVDTTADLGADLDMASEPDAGPSVPNLIFLTSSTYSPDFAFDGNPFHYADIACNEAADAALLDGTFVALLANDGMEARVRLAGARGWVRVDGAAVADEALELHRGEFFHLFQYNEDGERVEDPSFWTGSHTGDGDNCSGWTVATDASDGVTSHGYWLQRTFNGGASGCDEMHGLLCAQIDHNHEVAPPPAAEDSRLFFTSNDVIAPSIGLQAIDAACQTEFEAAFGMDTGREFRAFLASTDLAAAGRFNSTDAIWVRADDAVFNDNTSDFLAGNWDTWPARTAVGDPKEPGNSLSGATATDELGTNVDTCRGWTSVSSDDSGRRGSPRRWLQRFNGGSRNCTLGDVVYCAEHTHCTDVIVVDSEVYFEHTGTTVGQTNDFSQPSELCVGSSDLGFGEGSSDVAYALTSYGQTYFAINLTADFDATVYVINDCADAAGTCVAADQTVEERVGGFGFYPTLGATYYIIVDGAGNDSNDEGGYTITVEAS